MKRTADPPRLDQDADVHASLRRALRAVGAEQPGAPSMRRMRAGLAAQLTAADAVGRSQPASALQSPPRFGARFMLGSGKWLSLSVLALGAALGWHALESALWRLRPATSRNEISHVAQPPAAAVFAQEAKPVKAPPLLAPEEAPRPQPPAHTPRRSERPRAAARRVTAQPARAQNAGAAQLPAVDLGATSEQATTATAPVLPDPPATVPQTPDEAPRASPYTPRVPLTAATPAPPHPSPARVELDEPALLQLAHTRASGAPDSALALLAEHARRFPEGVLAQEREVLTIEILRAHGRPDAARKRLEAFARHYPGSVYLTQLR